jgi:proteic killer suppression protein
VRRTREKKNTAWDWSANTSPPPPEAGALVEGLEHCHPSGYTCQVVRSFRHKGLERFFTKGTKAGIRPEHAARLRLILARLHAAQQPKDMSLPGLRLHALKGELTGGFAVDVSGNWRVVFRFDGKDAIEVDYVDYH